MNYQENDKNIKGNKIKKEYIPLNLELNHKYGISSKLVFSFLLTLILVTLIAINIREKNFQLKTILPKKSIDNENGEKNFLENLYTFLDKDEIYKNEMMNKHTTFELGGPAKYFIKPKSINKIIKILKLCKEYSIDYFILGNGSNLLVSDKGYKGVVINIHENNFSELKVEKVDEIHYKVIVGGGILMRNLAKKLCLLSLSGLEDIIDIPGTIGGGIIMNASANRKKGLIINSLNKVKVITPEGEILELSKKECKLRGRGSLLQDKKYIVIEATFHLIKENKIIIQQSMTNHTSLRYSRQPMYFPSAGSFFVWKKHKFGSLYDKYKECNLVSYRIGDAMIYTHNIAFIVNLGNATSNDVYRIVTHVEAIFKKKYNIKIRREVVVLGSF